MVTDDSVQVLYELIKKCFEMNRTLDREVSVLGATFAMNNTAKKCHLGIAHYFPSLADKIGELCLERYNISVVYGETPTADKEYASPLEIISEMNSAVKDFQLFFMDDVCKRVFNNDDIQVYSDLLELLREYNKIVEQTILLEDKLKLYGNDLASYDSQVDKFWIL